MLPFTFPLTVYGGDDCDDTEHVTGRLREWGVPFREVILERDPDAERFVVFINGGYRSTPHPGLRRRQAQDRPDRTDGRRTGRGAGPRGVS